jgi:hypothetical protein
MSKKRDPLVAVIQYFNTVDLPAATQALTVVREIVHSRQPREAKKAAPAKRQLHTQASKPVPEDRPLPLNN